MEEDFFHPSAKVYPFYKRPKSEKSFLGPEHFTCVVSCREIVVYGFRDGKIGFFDRRNNTYHILDRSSVSYEHSVLNLFFHRIGNQQYIIAFGKNRSNGRVVMKFLHIDTSAQEGKLANNLKLKHYFTLNEKNINEVNIKSIDCLKIGGRRFIQKKESLFKFLLVINQRHIFVWYFKFLHGRSYSISEDGRMYLRPIKEDFVGAFWFEYDVLVVVTRNRVLQFLVDDDLLYGNTILIHEAVVKKSGILSACKLGSDHLLMNHVSGVLLLHKVNFFHLDKKKKDIMEQSEQQQQQQQQPRQISSYASNKNEDRRKHIHHNHSQRRSDETFISTDNSGRDLFNADPCKNPGRHLQVFDFGGEEATEEDGVLMDLIIPEVNDKETLKNYEVFQLESVKKCIVFLLRQISTKNDPKVMFKLLIFHVDYDFFIFEEVFSSSNPRKMKQLVELTERFSSRKTDGGSPLQVKLPMLTISQDTFYYYVQKSAKERDISDMKYIEFHYCRKMEKKMLERRRKREEEEESEGEGGPPPGEGQSEEEKYLGHAIMKIYDAEEKTINQKVGFLCSKYEYKTAVDILELDTKTSNRDRFDDLIRRIVKEHGDHVFHNSTSTFEYLEAARIYLMNPGGGNELLVDSSYVIEKFLSRKRFDDLIPYLRSLHERKMFNSSHTRLLLHFYIRKILNIRHNSVSSLEHYYTELKDFVWMSSDRDTGIKISVVIETLIKFGFGHLAYELSFKDYKEFVPKVELLCFGVSNCSFAKKSSLLIDSRNIAKIRSRQGNHAKLRSTIENNETLRSIFGVSGKDYRNCYRAIFQMQKRPRWVNHKTQVGLILPVLFQRVPLEMTNYVIGYCLQMKRNKDVFCIRNEEGKDDDGRGILGGSSEVDILGEGKHSSFSFFKFTSSGQSITTTKKKKSGDDSDGDDDDESGGERGNGGKMKEDDDDDDDDDEDEDGGGDDDELSSDYEEDVEDDLRDSSKRIPADNFIKFFLCPNMQIKREKELCVARMMELFEISWITHKELQKLELEIGMRVEEEKIPPQKQQQQQQQKEEEGVGVHRTQIHDNFFSDEMNEFSFNKDEVAKRRRRCLHNQGLLLQMYDFLERFLERLPGGDEKTNRIRTIVHWNLTHPSGILPLRIRLRNTFRVVVKEMVKPLDTYFSFTKTEIEEKEEDAEEDGDEQEDSNNLIESGEEGSGEEEEDVLDGEGGREASNDVDPRKLEEELRIKEEKERVKILNRLLDDCGKVDKELFELGTKMLNGYFWRYRWLLIFLENIFYRTQKDKTKIPQECRNVLLETLLRCVRKGYDKISIQWMYDWTKEENPNIPQFPGWEDEADAAAAGGGSGLFSNRTSEKEVGVPPKNKHPLVGIPKQVHFQEEGRRPMTIREVDTPIPRGQGTLVGFFGLGNTVVSPQGGHRKIPLMGRAGMDDDDDFNLNSTYLRRIRDDLKYERVAAEQKERLRQKNDEPIDVLKMLNLQGEGSEKLVPQSLTTAQIAQNQRLNERFESLQKEYKGCRNIFSVDNPNPKKVKVVEKIKHLVIQAGDKGEPFVDPKNALVYVLMYIDDLERWAIMFDKMEKMKDYVEDQEEKVEGDELVDSIIQHLYTCSKISLPYDLNHYYQKKKRYGKIVQTCQKFGKGEPILYLQTLQYFTERIRIEMRKRGSEEEVEKLKTHLKKVLTQLEKIDLVPPYRVLDVLSPSSHLLRVDVVNKFIKKKTHIMENDLRRNRRIISTLKNQVEKLDQEIDTMRTKGKRMVVEKCKLCGGKLKYPVVHFMCDCTYHLKCAQDNQKKVKSSKEEENEDEEKKKELHCPLCFYKNRKDILNFDEKYGVGFRKRDLKRHQKLKYFGFGMFKNFLQM